VGWAVGDGRRGTGGTGNEVGWAVGEGRRGTGNEMGCWQGQPIGRWQCSPPLLLARASFACMLRTDASLCHFLQAKVAPHTQALG